MRTKRVSLFQLYLVGALAVLLSGFTWAAPDTSTIRLATTTSTENSGLLDELLPKFKQATGYDVHVIAVGTGKALRMGRDGDVDVVLVHAPAAEQKFVDEGNGEQRLPVMFNDFVLVGPASDPAEIASAKTAGEAFGRIADRQTVFVSRGDDSGTHKKERSLWSGASIQPDGPWYREAGQGMGKVLQMANELEAYTLADRGTWLAYRDKSNLRVLFQGDEKLFNPYAIIEVSRQKYPDLNHQGAQALIDWIRGPQGQQAIGAFRKAGEQLFTPSAGTLARR